jgi:type III restriction enzyme
MFRAKAYQERALDTLGVYLDQLILARQKVAPTIKFKEEHPEALVEIPDIGQLAWEATSQQIELGRTEPYSTRRDEAGNNVPNVTLKVPTGGGKTFLAVQSVARVLDKYFLQGHEKVVLWIVPSDAIYRQTKRALLDRENPLRKSLDIASGNRLRVLEKDSPLNRYDLVGHWTIVLLMLQSTNRGDAEKTMKVYASRGGVNGFFPDDDDVPAHQELKQKVSNLDTIDANFIFENPEKSEKHVGLVKPSIGNALRLIQPMVILDEGQKAFAEKSHDAVYKFNPRFVMELSATPKDGKERKANWLVNISGTELKEEEMIKMPMRVHNEPGADWKSCLTDAWNHTEKLYEIAKANQADGGSYIRPILLVQSEVTGEKQLDSGKIHAHMVREHLISLGLSKEMIAIKTSEQDDLKNAEVQDLLSPASPIRVIITKQALQEGWDCPFAYVLCSLAASRSPAAMTQLVGRILRQPNATLTGIEALDQCYVFTHREDNNQVFEQIRDGLEGVGMKDLASQVYLENSPSEKPISRPRKESLRKRSYYLPKVLIHEGDGKVRDIDYETDILGVIDWGSLVLRPKDGRLPIRKDTELGGWMMIDFAGRSKLEKTDLDLNYFQEQFDSVFAVNYLADLALNPWVASRWVVDFLDFAKSEGWTDIDLAHGQMVILKTMEGLVKAAIEAECANVFDEGLASGRIVFDLVMEACWSLPESHDIVVSEGVGVFPGPNGRGFEKTAFPPVYTNELNKLELEVAGYFDKKEAVSWWYRNVVKTNGYGLQGWKKNRFYPDFIVAQEKDGELERWLVLETKGDFLKVSDDSVYKKTVMEKLSASYKDASASKLGQLTLFEKRADYHCELVAADEWLERFEALLAEKD